MPNRFSERKILCGWLAAILCLVVLVGVASHAAACYWYIIECEGQSFQDYDGGGEDVEYHSITPAQKTVTAGDNHVYAIHFGYSPGCGSRYSAKFYVMETDMPAGWSYTILDKSSNDINGVQMPDFQGTGDFYCDFTVTSPSSAADGEICKLTVRLWTNDTLACNEHNTLEVITETMATGGTGPEPITVSVTAPNGGEVWDVASQHDVTWTATGGVGTLTVDIEYSSSGLGGPWEIVSTSEVNDGAYTWTIPNTPSTDCYVKVTASDQSGPPQSALDTSDAAFEIKGGTPTPVTITIGVPNGGEVWKVGTAPLITWTASGGTSPLKITIEYSTTGSGGPWNPIAADQPNTGSYQWTIPNTPSTDCYVKATVTDSATTPQSASDANDAAFEIKDAAQAIPPTITLISPNGGDVYDVGSQQNLQWTTSGGASPLSITLEYSTAGAGGPWSTIAASIPNTCTYWWTVPNAPSTDCYVKATVKDSSSPVLSATDTGNAPFTIRVAIPPPMITVISPNGGEVWNVGEQHDITWTASGGTGTLTVDVQYSTDGTGGPWISIASVSNSGVYSWTVPDTPSDTCYVTITATDSGTPQLSGSDVGDAAFAIYKAPPIGALSGYVKDDKGNAVSGATVTVYVVSVVDSTTTDSTGKYSFDIAAGDYHIKAEKTGYNTCAPKDVSIAAGQTKRQDFTLATTTGTNPNSTGVSPLLYGIFAAIALIIVAALALIVGLRRRRKDEPVGVPNQYGYAGPPPQPAAQYSAPAYQGYQQQPMSVQYAQPHAYAPASAAPYAAPASAAYPASQQTAAGNKKICKQCGRANEKWQVTCGGCKRSI